MDGKRSALELWREKLEHLLAEEAIASDPEKKFQLTVQLREARQKIAELESQEKSRRFPDYLQSAKGNPEAPESNDKNTHASVVKNERRPGFWRSICRWWIGVKPELKVPVIAGLFAIVVAIVTGIFSLGVAIYNGSKVPSRPTPVLSAAPMPIATPTPNPPAPTPVLSSSPMPIATPTPNPPTRDMNQPIVPVANEVKIEDEIFLRDRDENYVTAADISPTGNNWPRLAKTGKVTLKLLGNGQVRNDSLVRIQSLEQKLNQKNVLFADSPACRYEKDESDVGRQTWKIVKDDSSDPVLHYGDRIYLENKNMRLSENGISLTIEKEGLRWWILEKK
jgi:hypothetical protein